MGSPSARLKTRESLRPWLESGLEFVLHPGGIPSEEPVQPQPVQQAMRQPVQQQVQSPSPAPAQSQGFVQQPSQVMQQAQPVPSSQQPQQQPQPATPGFSQPWAGYLKFAKPEPKVVWTYMELGLDLGGQSDPKRSAVLKNLQVHLRWPAGTINFWPVAGLVDGTLQPSTQMFWQGWELWRTPYIACFGEEALKVVLPDADPTLTTHMLEHVTIYVLPPLARLMTLLPHEQQMAVDILTSIRS